MEQDQITVTEPNKPATELVWSGQRLRQGREALGLSQLDVAQRMNLIQLIFALQQGDVAGMGQILRNLSVPFAGKVDEKAYMRDFQRVISRQLYVGGSGFGQTLGIPSAVIRLSTWLFTSASTCWRSRASGRWRWIGRGGRILPSIPGILL